ncbi:MAG: SRPBCC domain-containing protein [Arenicellales bacterium]|nr:SRPBCC domain-containing protein [Arenicellales bacterium]
MTGEHRIQASRESNWAALSDRNTLHQAISGCGNIDKISDTELKAKIKVVVGPVAMKLADLLAVTTCLLR